MSDEPEVDEKAIREADDAMTEEVEAWADRTAAYEAEVSARMKHALAALRLAGIQLDCTTANALRNLGDAMSTIIHECCDE